MQFMVSRRLVRLGGVAPPYRKKKPRAATVVALEMKITTLASYRSMGNFNWGPVYITTSFL